MENRSKWIWLLVFSNILTVAQSVLQPANSDQQYRVLQTLGRYDIGSPVIEFEGKVITLAFPLSDQVPDGTVSAKTFSDTTCTVDITGNDFLVPTILYDDDLSSDGDGNNREVSVRYDIHPNKIQQSDVWVQHENDQFFMEFCMRLRLHAGNATTTPSIASVDTTVLLQVDLLGGFASEFSVIPNDPNSADALNSYHVETFLCDENNEKRDPSIPFAYGCEIRVCVKPTDDALQAGVRMKSIQNFAFQQTNTQQDITFTQVAIRNGESTNSAMTTIFCSAGWELCHFTTQLRSDFYIQPGTVILFGEAVLQFGGGSARRKLEFQGDVGNQPKKGRALQNEEAYLDGFTVSAPSTLRLYTIPDSNNFQFRAIAYECDSRNQKVEYPIPKTFGDFIRICVEPDDISSRLGITINRIDSWNWTRLDGISQPAVEVGGYEAESDGRTILLCLPGSTLCIFETLFGRDFHASDATVSGIGNVVLQYGTDTGGISASRFLAQTSADLSSNQCVLQNQAESSIFAGTSEVEVNTWVVKPKGDSQTYCVGSKVSGWYEELPPETGVAVIAGSSMFPLWFVACCCCCCCIKYNEEEEQIVEEIEDIEIANTVNCVEYHETNTAVAKKSMMVRRDSETCTHGSSIDSDSHCPSRKMLTPRSSETHGVPDDNDVCFGDQSRSGTKKLLRVVREYIKESPDEQFGSHAYRHIKREMGKVQYFHCSEDGHYVEATRPEKVEMIGQLYADVKNGKVKGSKVIMQLDNVEGNTQSGQESHSLKLLKNDDHSSKEEIKLEKTSKERSRRRILS